ncbi:hypothetical protein LPB72_11005 [Hydrogenophaga crassostreae]|uniref:Lipopolysaccharide assembly protein A domain-containing protein n=1 Tax=Hydrogenophaga crassostreae TaxID=1763535 RepID=A0A167HWH4_9BURK|nr:hypothetical protein [Hydrogenophaga crassostreae]AOW13535.1 hypothetical protein LPB072_12385 [Hydrogenophaga crassostreae]OAD41826.1 hypothetical protein LPB72_11005 [Hydrogenophaga crassostreae]
MKNFSNLLAWGTTALIAVLAALNWSTLMADAPLNLLVAQIDAPLGVIMLALSGVMGAAFVFAYLHNHIGSLLETRKLLKEVQRAHDLADKAEASRIEALQKLIAKEFLQLNQRLGTGSAPTTGHTQI